MKQRLSVIPAILAMACMGWASSGCGGEASGSEGASSASSSASARTKQKEKKPLQVELVKVELSGADRVVASVKIGEDRFKIRSTSKPYAKHRGRDKKTGVSRYEFKVDTFKAGKHSIDWTFKHKDGRTKDLKVEFERKPMLLASKPSRIRCALTTCDGKLEPNGSFTMTADAGTNVKLGANALTAGADPVKMQLDLLPLALEHPAILKPTKQPSAKATLPLTLTLKDGTALTGELKWNKSGLRSILFAALWGATKKQPVRFKDEPAPPEKARRAMAVLTGETFLGAPSSFHEIDLVAVIHGKSRDKNCGKFTNRKTGAVKKFGFTVYSSTVKVYDRRTGKRVASKTFKGSRPRCPKNFTSRIPNGTYPSRLERTKWLKGLLQS